MKANMLAAIYGGLVQDRLSYEDRQVTRRIRARSVAKCRNKKLKQKRKAQRVARRAGR
jgi:hypothetical protein